MSDNISQAAQPRTSHLHLLHLLRHLKIQSTVHAFKLTAKNTTSSWKPKSTTKTTSENPWRKTRINMFLGIALIWSHSGSKLLFSLVEKSDSRSRQFWSRHESWHCKPCFIEPGSFRVKLIITCRLWQLLLVSLSSTSRTQPCKLSLAAR